MDRTTTEVTVSPQYQLPDAGRNYNHQYFSLYGYRYQKLKPRVMKAAMAKWGDGTKDVSSDQYKGQKIVRQDKILDIRAGQVCWVVGTIFCELKNKLNIFKDVEHGVDDVLPQEPSTYTDPEVRGAVMIEDESGRVVLHGDKFFAENLLVTGCTVGILGVEVNAGVFEILDVVHPDPILPPSINDSEATQGKVLVMSGALVEGGDVASDLRLELLKQYVMGDLGDVNDAAKITSIIILGNSVAEKPIEATDDFVSTNNYGTKNISRFDPTNIAKFDRWVAQLVTSVPVMVMPGPSDPAEICMPQQPLHPSVFAKARASAGLTRLTNPQYLQLGQRTMLLTAGQTINDIQKYVAPDDAEKLGKTTSVMAATLKWQNIAPTAPDTLYCYPYVDHDPFVINDSQMAPHIYMVGNQRQFETAKGDHGELLVSVPSFKHTGEVVVIDLASGECDTVTFET
ncbi:hypothetical protein DIURU_000102 [Diutina rugosa]|uniref:DNA-directed DNA polymerase n=1 Tax=Diutina rugosa TaxID=5481 RepID=A0A642UZM4_DIURU|nr:uncharacterized protein DIURU_000102 [Diutina rugosa]KAA8908559.1 hypothetical protein DIURU_000102 [Diutina rugosa]